MQQFRVVVSFFFGANFSPGKSNNGGRLGLILTHLSDLVLLIFVFVFLNINLEQEKGSMEYKNWRNLDLSFSLLVILLILLILHGRDNDCTMKDHHR